MENVLSNVKIVIIGDPSVGKTSLRRTYIGENFQANYIETIGSDFSFKTTSVKNFEIGLSIWDLAGQDKFLSVHPLFYKGSYGCIVVYSVIDRDTFDHIHQWIRRFVDESNRKFLPIMVIGNKIDRIDEYDGDIVSEDEHNEIVDQIAQEFSNHSITSFRTSALTGEKVEEGFNAFAKDVFEWIMIKSDASEESQYTDDIDKNLPGAYALVMNQLFGPQLVATHPPMDKHSDLYLEMSNSTIKLVASLDFNDIISQSAVISSHPWVKPRGQFHYIAFVLDNSQARGKNELFVIGLNVARELSEPISGIKGVLDGFLHNVINEFARIYLDTDLKLVTEQFDPDAHPKFVKKFEKILENLRINIHESLKRWYNIPS